jgi:small subunit ribosomal protein S6
MKKYETVIVLTPEMEEQEQKSFIEKLSGILNSAGSSVEKIDYWGKRKLAYPIKKKLEGSYICMTYQADGENVKELERVLRVTENVLRYLTVRVEERKIKKTKIKPQHVAQPTAG